jgi:hypothetical protein
MVSRHFGFAAGATSAERSLPALAQIPVETVA